MAAGKELRTKIKSVENTKKITKAMEMISVSKMRKAQERMRAARPYSEKIRSIANNLGQANPEYVHTFMKKNDGKSVGFIVVTTDKGLCGGLNTNLLRAVTAKLRETQSSGKTPNEGHARCVCGGRSQRGLYLLQQVCQHHEPSAHGGFASALVG
jgi:F-type H+-transporting ATPase subunit gamma